jgi:hypothetical protein
MCPYEPILLAVSYNFGVSVPWVIYGVQYACAEI